MSYASRVRRTSRDVSPSSSPPAAPIQPLRWWAAREKLDGTARSWSQPHETHTISQAGVPGVSPSRPAHHCCNIGLKMAIDGLTLRWWVFATQGGRMKLNELTGR